MKNNNRSSLIFVILGVICISLAFLFNQFTYFAFFGNAAFSVHIQVSFLLLDVGALIVGSMLLVYRNNAKQLIFAFIYIALIMFSVELALNVGHYAIDNNDTKINRKSLLSPYRGKEWSYEFWKDHGKAWNADYEPFIGWDRREYHSKYTNVNSDGFRETWKPKLKSEEKSKQKTIYMFGGSTMWGSGARDNFTIPSSLSKILSKNGYHFKVINCGETAYTFLQEIIHLILLLRDGYRPDYVLFYDGSNDVYGAYQNGIAGATHNLEHIRRKLKASASEKEQLKKIIIYYLSLQWTMVHRDIVSLYHVISSPKIRFKEKAANYTETELEKLSRDITTHYKTSISLLDNLSKVYGFKYLCFWQPVIYTEESITEEEKTVVVRVKDESAGKLYKYVNQILQSKDIPYFYNISNVLKGHSETVYTDFCHLAENGNAIVAKKMFLLFEEEFLLNE